MKTLLSADAPRFNPTTRSTLIEVDAFKTLTSIHSNPEVFLEEYRKLLAEQLVSRDDCNIERERLVVEFLKKRYGEGPLHKCEVMLNDIYQSVELNNALKNSTQRIAEERALSRSDIRYALPILSTTIISYLFWPEAKEPDIIVPPDIQLLMDVYGEQYHNKKRPRQLTWRTGTGMVELDVYVQNEKTTFKVSPVLATILYHFQEHPEIEAQHLAQLVGIDVSTLMSKITFWINNGVIEEAQENGQTKYRRKTTMEKPSVQVTENSDAEAEERRTSKDSDSAKFECFKTYILEFLNHHPGSTVEEIHNHLEKFVKQHRFDMSQGELNEYLATLGFEGIVEVSNGMYKLRA